MYDLERGVVVIRDSFLTRGNYGRVAPALIAKMHEAQFIAPVVLDSSLDGNRTRVSSVKGMRPSH